MKPAREELGAKPLHDGQRLVYPIPPDGQPLYSAHLRDQSLLILRMAGLATQTSRWGFFSRVQVAGELSNEIAIDDRGILSVRNLAVLTRAGVAVVAPELTLPLGEIGKDELIVHVGWAFPESAVSSTGGSPVVAQLLLRSNGQAEWPGVEYAEAICSVSRPAGGALVVRRTAPLLDAYATPESTAAAEGLSGRLAAVAEAIMVSRQDIPRFERLLVREALLAAQLARGASAAAEARHIIHAVELATAIMISFSDSSADRAVAAGERLAQPEDGAEAWTAWVGGAYRRLSEDAPLVQWIRAARDEIEPMAGDPLSDEGRLMRWRYDLPSGTTEVQLSVSGSDPIAPALRWRIDRSTFQLADMRRQGEKFSTALKMPSMASSVPAAAIRLEVLAPQRSIPLVRAKKGVTE